MPGPTLPTDYAFKPKVWADHVAAFFEKKLSFGVLAVKDYTLTQQPGTTLNFPYFKAIGAAEKPAANVALTPDKLTDDSFSCTVAEYAKAVSFTKASFFESAAKQQKIEEETTSQIARVIAEGIEADLITEINTAGNYEQGFTAAATTDICTVQNLLRGKINAFGDKQDQAEAILMHSQHYLSAFTDTTQGMLKADASDPLWGVGGFVGRLLGMAVFVNDNVPRGTDITGKRVYHAFVTKANAYGFMLKQELDMEMDKDILAREWIVAGTQWGAVKAFHAKIHAGDKRIARLSFATEMAA